MLKIVIVEPEIFTLLGIKGAMEQSPDIEVTGDATSGKLGFQLIEQTNPDVVLVDLLLPDMSGLELTRSIKRKTNSKVVIFTNQTHSDFINSAFRNGADSYMLKSADIELIELAIKRAYLGRGCGSGRGCPNSISIDAVSLIAVLPQMRLGISMFISVKTLPDFIRNNTNSAI